MQHHGQLAHHLDETRSTHHPGAPPGAGGPPPPGGGGPYGGYPPPPPGGPYPGGYPGYPPVPGAPFGIEPVSGLAYSDKQKLAAGLLQFLMPGVGRIYAGHVGLGVAQLLTAFICVGYVWAVIDGIMILAGKVADPLGRPLRD